MTAPRALIVGASIAGPSTAYWLTKAGYRVTVIERFPSLRTGGQAIDIRTCGVAVMRKMRGMEERVRAKSTQEEGVALVNAQGKSLGVIRATGNPERQGLVSEYEIFRGDLARVLVDLTMEMDGVEYVFGEQIALMRQNADSDGPVVVEFTNGMQTAEYDLVVACDGATSRTRAMGFGCGVRDDVIPSGSWAAYFSTPRDLNEGSKIGHGFSAPGGRAMSIGSDPAGGSRVMLMAVNQQSSALEFREAASHGEDALKKYLIKRYEGAGWRIDELLQEIIESKDLYASEIVQVKAPSLYKGRVVLVGDAGYAAGPTGGGTSLALTGGYMLAGELTKCGGNIEAGLKGYQERMGPLIKDMQKIPPFVGTIMAPQTAWGIWVRNTVWSVVAWTGVAEFLGQYLGAAFADNGDFKLPEYEWKN